MTAPNMEKVTASLERSLQNCSLNQQNQRRGRVGESTDIGSPEVLAGGKISGDGDAVLELNSHVSLPYHWEQCLDLKTGEIYYINWSDGTRSSEDPRLLSAAAQEYRVGGDYYYYSSDDDDDSSYDSEDSSPESSPFAGDQHCAGAGERSSDQKDGTVLVVAGCKSCLMYYMVPKPVGDCPKCSGQLLHFDRSDEGSS